MTRTEFLLLLRSDDLTQLGARADAERRRLHPDGIVTYCVEEGEAVRIVLRETEPDWEALEMARETLAAVPVCAPGLTGAEYLKFLSACRLYLPVPHLQLDPGWSGLKVAQIALRFGADDFGNTKPSSPASEEEIRRLIREAGFVPKRRDPLYRSLSLY